MEFFGTAPRSNFQRCALRYCLVLCIAFGFACLVQSQTAEVKRKSWSGDAPLIAPPIARGISPALKRHNVVRAIRLVADWELNRATDSFNQDWTFATLYAGFMSVPDEAGGRAYRNEMLRMATKFGWQPGPRLGHADDEAVGQTYLDLYLQLHDPSMMMPIRSNIDAVMRQPDDPQKPLWWWCDALFMAPPVLVRLYEATGNRSYLDFMDHEWWITSKLLYNETDHLYSRDKTFLSSRERNGRGLYWSRGNGWVLAGLVRVLSVLPADYPSRAKYVAQFREMAEKIAAIQGADGLWRPGLLDPEAYKLPEVSGSAFYTYALAYGVNSGLLNRKQYLPVVKRAWAGLLAHIYSDGRLGCVQPVGAAPGDYIETSSYVFGTGAFLLAGSEVYHLAR